MVGFIKMKKIKIAHHSRPEKLITVMNNQISSKLLVLWTCQGLLRSSAGSWKRKTFYFLLIIIFLLDAILTGNISVVYGPILLKFSAHTARLMFFLMTPKRVTNTFPVQSKFPFPYFFNSNFVSPKALRHFQKS